MRYSIELTLEAISDIEKFKESGDKKILMKITTQRLANLHLTGDKFTTPKEAVHWLGAVQAQDYLAAKWAIGQRLQNGTDDLIERACNDGKIIRTHIMRPTWHFVDPADVRWMQSLTSHRVKKFMGSSNRKLGLDDKLLTRTNKAIVRVLEGHNYLTRQEIKKVLSDIGIPTDVQRLAHIVMNAELDSLICSGPRRGRQFTYALLDERVPETIQLSKEEMLARLTFTYFKSHGPAQLIDFAWWSGLTQKEANEGLELVRNQLEQKLVEEKTYWYDPLMKISNQSSLPIFLLSIFDEYTIAYKDRGDISDKRDIERMISMGNALTSVIILHGKVGGTWKRVLQKKKVLVTASPFRKLTVQEEKQLDEAVESYASFLGLQAGLDIQYD